MKKIMIMIVLLIFTFSVVDARNFFTKDAEKFDFKYVELTYGDSTNYGKVSLHYPKRMEHFIPATQAILNEIDATYSRIFSGFAWETDPDTINAFTAARKKLISLFSGLRNADSTATDTTIVYTDTAVVKKWRPKEITLVVYPSLQDFTRQRILWQFISPGVLGFNETTAWRVAVPYPGSCIMFKNVMYHEFAHAWMFNLVRSSLSQYKPLRRYDPKEIGRVEFPLWFIEGFAEHLNHKFNQEHNPSYLAILRKTVIRSQVTNLFSPIPEPAKMMGMDVYDFGCSFMNWLDNEYGFEQIIAFIVQRVRARNFDKAWENFFGETVEDMAYEWQNVFYPYFKPFFADSVKSSIEKIHLVSQDEDEDEDELVYYGRIGYDRNKIAYYTNDNKWFARVEVRDLFNGETWKIHRMFEHKTLFYKFGSAPIISGNQVALIVNKDGQDELHMYRLEHRSILKFPLKRIKVTHSEEIHCLRKPEILSINNPAFDTYGSRIVFEGIGLNGFSDLYIWDMKKDTVIQLTDDIYQDTHPQFLRIDEDNERIVFISDRLDQNKNGVFDIQIGVGLITDIYQPEKTGVFVDQILVSPNNKYIAMSVVSIDHSPQVYLWEPSRKIYHVISTFRGISQIIGWADLKIMLVADERGEIGRFYFDDLETYPYWKAPSHQVKTTTWSPDEPDTLISPTPETGWRYKYLMLMGYNTIGWATATGEEVFLAGAQLNAGGYAGLSEVFYSVYLNKIDLRSRLHKYYGFSAYRYFSYRLPTKNSVHFRNVIDHTIRMDARFYWPIDLENGIGISITSGWLRREYPQYTISYDNLSPGAYLRSRTEIIEFRRAISRKTVDYEKLVRINNSYHGWRITKVSTYESGPIFGNGLYFVHDAVFGSMGEALRGSWLVTQLNWLLLKDYVSEGQFLLDGRFYMQLFGSRSLIANRLHVIKSFGRDRPLQYIEDPVNKFFVFYNYRIGTDATLIQNELRFPLLNWIAVQLPLAKFGSNDYIFGFKVNAALFHYAGKVWMAGYKTPFNRRAGLAVKLMVGYGVSLQYEFYKLKWEDSPWSEWRRGIYVNVDF